MRKGSSQPVARVPLVLAPSHASLNPSPSKIWSRCLSDASKSVPPARSSFRAADATAKAPRWMALTTCVAVAHSLPRRSEGVMLVPMGIMSIPSSR